MDLRELVFAAAEVGDMTQREIAETFQVSVAWIRKLQKLARESNSLASKPHGGGESGAFNGESAERLIQAVKDQLDATLKQLASLAGVSCSTSATDRMLRKLGITRKKRYDDAENPVLGDSTRSRRRIRGLHGRSTRNLRPSF